MRAAERPGLAARCNNRGKRTVISSPESQSPRLASTLAPWDPVGLCFFISNHHHVTIKSIY